MGRKKYINYIINKQYFVICTNNSRLETRGNRWRTSWTPGRKNDNDAKNHVDRHSRPTISFDRIVVAHNETYVW